MIKKLEAFHSWARSNNWMHLFTWFNRIMLAAGFIPSGLVKIMGERFTALADQHPMGAYLEALYHTGFYYPIIGYFQVLAALLILIPRTTLIGAFIYLPIIFNIFVLTISVRFDGSLITSPLMLISVIYLICWDYQKWKFILPSFHKKTNEDYPSRKVRSWKFPFKFAVIVVVIVLTVLCTMLNVFSLMPRNEHPTCIQDCGKNKDPEACQEFCDCIHLDGRPWDQCLEEYDQSTHKQ